MNDNMINTNPKKISELLSRGVEEVINRDHLEKELKSGKRLRIKFGIDPTSPDLHLGHSIPLRKLKQFQDLGHDVVLLIGDFTATIGDPSSRTTQRKRLTMKEVKKNMKDYVKQAGRFLNLKKIEIRYNSEWYNKKGALFLMELYSKFTVARVMERDDFKQRLKDNIDISMLELTYPLLQGYDSVELKSNVEIGGNDQKFNLLMGRKVQKRYKQPEQDIITLSLLEGTDGIRKMSKSYGNSISINEKPLQMYGKIMSIPDELMWKYFKLLTEISIEEIERIKQRKQKLLISPRDIKAKLAREIVKIYYSEEKAKKAEEEFDKIFKNKQSPSKIEIFKTNKKIYFILNLLFDTKLVSSKNEAKRLVEGGAVTVEINNKKLKINDWRKVIDIRNDMIIKVGRKFKRIKLIK